MSELLQVIGALTIGAVAVLMVVVALASALHTPTHPNVTVTSGTAWQPLVPRGAKWVTRVKGTSDAEVIENLLAMHEPRRSAK